MLTIHHHPFGNHHPYESSAIERQPRQPVAGDEVIIGTVTSPAGSVLQLELIVSINNSPGLHITAQRLSEDSDATTWRAQFPPVQAGDRVRYHFIANDGEGVSEVFEFTTAGWHTATRLQNWRRVAGGILLQLEPGLFVTFGFTPENQLQIRYTADAEDVPPAMGSDEGALQIAESTEYLTIAGNGLRIQVQRDPYQLVVTQNDGRLLFDETLGGLRWLVCNQEILRISHAWHTPPDERFFGFGERFNAFDQRGQQIDTLVYEQYKNQERRTYLPVPFFMSSRGYGLFLQTAHRASFDLAASQKEVATFVVEDDSLELTLFVGEPKAILPAFVEQVGKAILPPKWVFGLWMSSNEWNSQAQVLEQVRLTNQHAIPATVLVIEAWSDEATFYIFNDAQYLPHPGNKTFTLSDFTFPAEGRWPAPKAMVDALHQQGIRLLLWQIPVFKKLDEPHAQHDLDMAYALSQKLVLQHADGAPYHIRPFWFHDGLVPDFSNAALEQWWFAHRRYLIDELGVDGFKTDGGEHIWGDEVRATDSSCGGELINRFANHYESAYARFAGPERVLFSRAGYTGSQAFSTHWAGDENSTFAAFRHSITAGLTAGASGFTFWGWDIGGFGGGIPSAELYLRATAMATFCPIMQYHSEYNPERIECRDRTPWNVQAHTSDPQVIPLFRFFANLRMNLLPHIWSEAIKASRHGLPLMRALMLEFPMDQQVAAYPYQYLFGENLLIAPVAWEGCSALDVYLPVGAWYDFWTGELHNGAQVLRCPTPLNRIPVFVRAGSVVALHLANSLTPGDPVGNGLTPTQQLVLRAYPAAEKASFSWYSDPEQPPQIFEILPYE